MGYDFYSDMTITGPADEIARFKKMYSKNCEHVYGDEPGCFDCQFYISGSMLIGVLQGMGKNFPALDFSLRGFDLIAPLAYRGSIKNGKLALREVPITFENAEGEVFDCLEGAGSGSSFHVGE